MLLSLRTVLLLLAASASAPALGAAVPQLDATELAGRETSPKLVFAHFMIGIVSDRTSPADYDADMERAKAVGIDAFALNIGVDPYTDQQLGYAYQSAANNGMKVFISFDFNWYHSASDAALVGQKVKQYGTLPAQLRVDNKVFVSSFAGDGLDIAAVRSAAGMDLFIAPNFHPGQADFSQLDAAFNWLGWPNNGNNKAPQPGGQVVSVHDGDQAYLAALGGKPYMAAVSPWFSTHFGAEVSYSKNWVFPSDLLWYQRWNEILTMQPAFVEIVTWNDYGESHYVAPLESPHTDDGGSKWVKDMPHVSWLEMAKPYIAAYKAGSKDASSYITQDELVYWYRTAPRDLNCDSTDTTMASANNASGNYFEGRPNGYDSLTDSVFVVSLLTAPATVTINSGGTLYTADAPKGAAAFAVDMKLGVQAFALERSGKEVLSGASLMEIKNECPNGIYNFNAYVGSLPPTASDALQPDGMRMFCNGLKVSCNTASSLPSTPPTPANPTTTVATKPVAITTI
ncbi:glycoside hydrolase family 71 protein [Botryobasidium botryosum FD-172 SS1]|uniref:Glycoside hydrolase family 71 protein n=1 Tax=Botryobasidium botryosum (strain FD-172 SS1) TaxID=930990 RepID=A0A067MFY7_BOTB1|nr:glycoside hydrolase family 71 protein [Botryobasidium botryosum FD-172 SS1]